MLGIIGAIILIRYICGIKLEKEEEQLKALDETNANKKPYKMHLEVTNKYLEGKTLLQVHDFLNRDFVVSRLVHEGELFIPNRDTIFHIGDQMLIVCAEADQEAIMAFIGPKLDIDFEQQDQPMVSKRILITNPKINGKSLASMHFSSMYGVNVTRVTRQGMDIFASASLPLQVGDRIMVVGPEDAVDRVANKMGNSIRRLDAPNIATIFVGIIIGIIFGSLPIAIPGMPVPLKLGIAGGPLIIAILIGRYGYKIHLVTYTTTSANMMLREIGLVLFLASVGIKAGAGFFETVVRGRRTALRPYGLLHHGYPHPDCRSDSPSALQVQLLHHYGYAGRYLYRSPCTGFRQQHLLEGGTGHRLFNGLSAVDVPAHLHCPDSGTLLLWITNTIELIIHVLI